MIILDKNEDGILCIPVFIYHVLYIHIGCVCFKVREVLNVGGRCRGDWVGVKKPPQHSTKECLTWGEMVLVQRQGD